MNALCGLLHLDGAPADPAHLRRMTTALADGRTGPRLCWQGGPVALACLDGETRREERPPQPVWDETSGVGLVAGSRLINRGELHSQLAAHLPLPDSPSEAYLLRAAWQVWGVECAHRLDGDWHFVLWDAPARRLFLARSHAGCSALYYRQLGNTLLFASTQKPLIGLAGLADRPNLARMAEILCPDAEDGATTGYVDVLRLPPAHWMVVDGGGVHIRRYWFPEDMAEERLESDNAYAEKLLCLLGRAVERRLACQGEVGISLSGGLDSGGVAALAAPSLAAGNRRLAAFTSVPFGPPAASLARQGPTDESGLAAAVATHIGNIDLRPVTAERITPLAGIEWALRVHDEPSHPAGNCYWLWAVQQAAQSQGVGVLLTGTAGNNTLSWTGLPPDLTPLLWPWRWAEMADALAALRGRSHAGLGRLLLAGIARPLARSLRDGLAGPRPGPSALSPVPMRFWQRVGMPGVLESLEKEQEKEDPRRFHWRSFGPGVSSLGARQYQTGWESGLDLLDPTGDRALVEFCATVPAEQFHSGVQDRRLMRRALAGLLPEAVRLQRGRGRQAADLGYRVAASQGEIADALARLGRHPLAAEALDLPRMERLLQQAVADPIAVSQQACSLLLLRGVMIGLFLSRF
ncbi:MAG: hypothetical protein KJZ86_19740 [Caldilineaceae bacterium]|nr:hypothetical protein [Caldilineaceae bacterium]